MTKFEQALDKLIEECSEVIQAAIKIKRFGISNWKPNTKKFNSIALIEEIDDLYEAAKTAIKEMPRPSHKYMVGIVSEWLKGSNERLQEEFKTTQFDDLVIYHSTLGRDIRNEFRLWAYPHEPELDENGVDVSKEHPDAISMRVIEEVWRKAQDAS